MEDSLTIFAMTKKGSEVLGAVVDMHREIIDMVVGSRDWQLETDYYDEIRDTCVGWDIPFFDRSEMPPMRSSHALAVSWRWLIDPGSTMLIVLHDSLLPKYRGFNPLVSALINGEHEIGVTAVHAAEEYDRGAIIAQAAVPISYPLRIQEAIDLLLPIYRELSLDVVSRVRAGERMAGRSQDESLASYSLWRDEHDYRIDWSRPSDDIVRFIHALGHPYRGALSEVNGKGARIRDAIAVKDVRIENRTPGKVIFLNGINPVVVCGIGLLMILDLIDAETGSSLLPLKRFRSRFS